MFKNRLQDKVKKVQLRILALGIYGVVLFLLAEGIINFEVANVFKSVVTLKVNPTTILVETLYSLKTGRVT